MPLPDIDTALDWRGRNVVDRNGEKIGKFDELYLDEETSRPEWAAVTTGLFGRKQSLIPLSEARLEGDDLQVPFDQEQVKEAPALDPDEQLSQEEERQLYSHYGIEHSTSGSETVLPGQEAAVGRPGGGAEAGTEREGSTESAAGQTERAAGGEVPPAERETPAGGTAREAPGGAGGGETAGPSDATPAGVAGAASRARDSEEGEGTTGEGSLQVGTEVKPRERVRLKKYVVTEEVTKKVPVSREEVRLEREPAGEDETGSGQVAEGEEQVVLSEEEPVVQESDETSDQREER